jgi:hypothetical protein
MVGASAFMETLELALALRRAKYGSNGERLGLDLFPYTEDQVAAVRGSVEQWRFIDSVAERIDDAALREAQMRTDAVAAYELVYAALGARAGHVGAAVAHQRLRRRLVCHRAKAPDFGPETTAPDIPAREPSARSGGGRSGLPRRRGARLSAVRLAGEGRGGESRQAVPAAVVPNIKVRRPMSKYTTSAAESMSWRTSASSAVTVTISSHAPWSSTSWSVHVPPSPGSPATQVNW